MVWLTDTLQTRHQHTRLIIKKTASVRPRRDYQVIVKMCTLLREIGGAVSIA